ncbi:MAG: biopolymer transporter ExbD [Epsilonproteobacteria bacterium]|nr:MAG: biopolymer transporter ExbD [Campylobacterota bacterium]
MFGWDDDPDLNITPLVDVMLVLMAILMITAPTINFEEQIVLPKGSQSKKVDNVQTMTIRMDKDRIIYLNKETYTLDNFADNFLLKSPDFNLDSNVFIRADEKLAYRDVMYLLKSVKHVGFSKVSLITE